MTDKEIIQKLIDRDKMVTQKFFYEYCNPLFRSIIHRMFNYPVDYDEFVNELYVYLLEDDAKRLRSFKGECSLLGWLKMVAIRYFMNKKNHDRVIENESTDPPIEKKDEEMTQDNLMEPMLDVETLLSAMPNERYSYVIRKLIIEDMAPEDLAVEMAVTVANLYNIKKRAIAQLTRVALSDITNLKIN